MRIALAPERRRHDGRLRLALLELEAVAVEASDPVRGHHLPVVFLGVGPGSGLGIRGIGGGVFDASSHQGLIGIPAKRLAGRVGRIHLGGQKRVRFTPRGELAFAIFRCY